LDNWGAKAREILKECGIWTCAHSFFADYFPNRLDEIKINPPFAQSLKDRQPDTDLIIVDLNRRWDANFFERFPKLKAVVSCTTGLDHIDTDYCREKGIKVISLQGETDFLQDVYATAEHTWALILSLIRKVPAAFDDVKRGNWDRESWQGTELHGKTIGVVGYGRVGRQVAKIAQAFGMKVIANDLPSGRYDAPYRNHKVEFCTLDTLLRYADIITVHIPLNEETRGMFGAEQFAIMKPKAFFVNTSRGEVVNTKDLLHVLYMQEIAGAALDVLENESYCPDDETIYDITERNLNNLIITPHIAGNTTESREKTQLFIANKIKEFILGGG
jgi:D-3-phosphoglycerate dehydrogenase